MEAVNADSRDASAVLPAGSLPKLWTVQLETILQLISLRGETKPKPSKFAPLKHTSILPNL